MTSNRKALRTRRDKAKRKAFLCDEEWWKESLADIFWFKARYELEEYFESVSPETFLENRRWKDGVVSPFDPESKVYKCKNNRYKCRNTNKYFNVKTGTIFEDSNIKLSKWFVALYLLLNHSKGISSVQLAIDIDVTQKIAWYIKKRVLEHLPRFTVAQEVHSMIEKDTSLEVNRMGKEGSKRKDKPSAQERLLLTSRRMEEKLIKEQQREQRAKDKQKALQEKRDAKQIKKEEKLRQLLEKTRLKEERDEEKSNHKEKGQDAHKETEPLWKNGGFGSFFR